MATHKAPEGARSEVVIQLLWDFFMKSLFRR